MKRSKIIVLEAPKGYQFGMSEEDSGELKITLIPTVATEYSGNYTNPPIPEGWKHVEGEWNNGFVIQDSKGNQFVWVPVGFLDANGTLDGTNFSEFGRRKYDFNEELHKQWESVQKYGGFYISRYNISKSSEGKPQSVKGVMPWTNIDWFDAMEAAKTFGDGVSVKSHLPFGAEYDLVLKWFIKSQARTKEEIVGDSTKWGNFYNTRNAPDHVVKTGTHEEWSTNKICDLAGNVNEWTQDLNKSSYPEIRGGSCIDCGDEYPVAYRGCRHPYASYGCTGFRAALFLA